MPNYNKASFLNETLNSVLSQTYADWEIILVDDGSTDDSREIIANFALKDKRIKPVYREKQINGGSVCRNIGIDKSIGEFIMFLDSDDLLEANCIEQRLLYFSENSSLDFIVTTMGSFKSKIGDSNYIWLPNFPNPLQKFLRHELPWTIMQPTWKKEFVQELGGFSSNYSRMQDVELHTRALIKSKEYLLVDGKADCWYRFSDERLTLSHGVLMHRFFESAVRYFKEFDTPLYHSDLKMMILEVCSFGIHKKNSGFVSKNEFSKTMLESNLKEIIQSEKFWQIKVYLRLSLIFPFHLKGLKRITRLLLN